MKRAFYFILALSLLVFASCKNFMNAGEVKEQIENQIKEANAKSVKVVISQDTTMGTFLSSGEKECKLGYSINVQFNLKKDAYIFKGLKAVSTSGADISRKDYVVFTIKDRDDEKGIYKVEIQVVKDADDLMIIPDCTLVPGVVKEECLPVYSDAGCEQDTAIVITFNKPVSATENFTLSITDYSGNSLSDYYNDPYFSSDGTVLYIPTNKELDLLEVNGHTNNKDIFIKFDLSNIVDEEGNTGKTTFQYKYRVNKQKDSVKPVLNNVRVYSTNDKSSKNYKQIFSKNSNSWDSDSWMNPEAGHPDHDANHVSGTIYIELEGTDIGAGIGNVLVKEKLLNTAEGVSLSNPTAVEYHNPCYTDLNTGLHYCTYAFNTSSDGILEIEIFAEDYSGNSSTASRKFWVLKDTLINSLDITFNEEFTEVPSIENNNLILTWTQVMQDKLDEMQIQGDLQTVSLSLNENTDDSNHVHSKDYYYSDFYTDYNVSVYWGESENKIETPIIKNAANKYVFTRDVKKYVYIKLVCEDSVGNVREIVKRMPPRAEMSDSDEGEYDISNFSVLMVQSNLPLPDPASGSDPAAYCNFIYEFTSTDTNHPLTFSEVLPGNIADRWDLFHNHIAKMFYLKQYAEEQKNPETTIQANGIYVTGDLKIYISTTFGDFPSPKSKNYLSTTITSWDERSDPGSDVIWYRPEFGEMKLSSASENQPTTKKNGEFGPANRNYIPTNTPIKITATPLSGLASFKIMVDDYKTQAGLDDGVIYTIHVIAIKNKGEGYEPEVSKQFSTSTTSPEIVLTANLIYKFYIEAFNPNTGTSYIPYPYLGTGTDPNTGETIETIDISKPGMPLHIESTAVADITDSQDSLEDKSHNSSSEQSESEQSEFSDPDANDRLVLRKDLAPPYIAVAVGNTVGTYNIMNDFGNAGSIRITLLDIDSDYTGLGNQGYNDPLQSFKKNENGNYELPYYIIPNPRSSIKSIPSYTINELETEYSSFRRIFECDGEHSFYDIPFGNIEGGSYTISFVPEDIYNNTTVYTFPFINRTLGYMDYTFEGDNPRTFTHIADSDPPSYTYYDLIVDHEMLSYLTDPAIITIEMDRIDEDYGSLTKKWTYYPSNPNNIETLQPFATEPFINSSGEVLGQITHTRIKIDNTNQWRRFRPYQGFNAYDYSTNNKGFYYNNYFFVGENSKCTIKNCIDGLNGVQIISDNSVLIHTMYSNEKLTESRTVEDAAAIWETKGLETGLVTFDYSNDYTTSPELTGDYDQNGVDLEHTHSLTIDGLVLNRTYGLSNFKDIPSGFYYTTIAHFADGTVVMTDIKQKQ